ncbi:uncharacterized protein LOC144074313 [Stigmatopora argus]
MVLSCGLKVATMLANCFHARTGMTVGFLVCLLAFFLAPGLVSSSLQSTNQLSLPFSPVVAHFLVNLFVFGSLLSFSLCQFIVYCLFVSSLLKSTQSPFCLFLGLLIFLQPPSAATHTSIRTLSWRKSFDTPSRCGHQDPLSNTSRHIIITNPDVVADVKLTDIKDALPEGLIALQETMDTRRGPSTGLILHLDRRETPSGEDSSCCSSTGTAEFEGKS